MRYIERLKVNELTTDVFGSMLMECQIPTIKTNRRISDRIYRKRQTYSVVSDLVGNLKDVTDAEFGNRHEVKAKRILLAVAGHEEIMISFVSEGEDVSLLTFGSGGVVDEVFIITKESKHNKGRIGEVLKKLQDHVVTTRGSIKEDIFDVGSAYRLEYRHFIDLTEGVKGDFDQAMCRLREKIKLDKNFSVELNDFIQTADEALFKAPIQTCMLGSELTESVKKCQDCVRDIIRDLDHENSLCQTYTTIRIEELRGLYILHHDSVCALTDKLAESESVVGEESSELDWDNLKLRANRAFKNKWHFEGD